MNLDERLDEIVRYCFVFTDEGQPHIFCDDEAKQAIKQLVVDELEKIVNYINTDTNDVCWKHSPEDTPMIHSSRVEYLKDYVEQKIKELKDGS